MRLFTIGDLHLSFGVPDKPMDIFGGWKDYQKLLEQNWLERRILLCWQEISHGA